MELGIFGDSIVNHRLGIFQQTFLHFVRPMFAVFPDPILDDPQGQVLEQRSFVAEHRVALQGCAISGSDLKNPEQRMRMVSHWE
jgi:hypothetical protein